MQNLLLFQNSAEALEALKKAKNRSELTDKDLAESTISVPEYNPRRGPSAIRPGSQKLFDALKVKDKFRPSPSIKESFAGQEVELKNAYQHFSIQFHPGKFKNAIVFEKTGNPEAYLKLLTEATGVKGYRLEYLKLVNPKKKDDFLRGVCLTRCDSNATPLPLKISGCMVHALHGKHDRRNSFSLPMGYRHEFIEQYDFLLPKVKPKEVFVWTSTNDIRKGHWIKWHLELSPLADLISFQNFAGKINPRPRTNAAEDKKLEVEIRLRRDPFVGHWHELYKCNVVEFFMTKEGESSSKLKDALDYIEADQYLGARYYFQQKEIHSFAPIEHYIRYTIDASKRVPLLLGANQKRYIQPQIFAPQHLNIPLFVQQGYSFSPDITSLLNGLEDDHRLKIQLREMCKDATDDDDIVYLIGPSEEDSEIPELRKLSNSIKFTEQLGLGDSRLMENMHLKEVVSNFKTTGNVIRKHRDARQEDLLRLCKKEEKAIHKEIVEVIDQLSEHVKRTVAECGDLKGQKDEIIALASELKTCIEKEGPESWNSILDYFVSKLNDLANPRLTWIGTQEARTKNETRILRDRHEFELALKERIQDSLSTLGEELKTCQEIYELIEQKLAKAIEQEDEFNSLVSNSDAVVKKIKVTLKEWRAKLWAKKKENQANQSRLNREKDLALRKQVVVAATEKRLNQIQRDVDKIHTDVIQRKGIAISREAALTKLRDVTIPRLEEETRVTNERIGTLEEGKYEQRSKEMSDANSRLREQMSDLEGSKSSYESKLADRNRCVVRIQELDDEISKLTIESNDLNAKLRQLKKATLKLEGVRKTFSVLPMKEKNAQEFLRREIARAQKVLGSAGRKSWFSFWRKDKYD